MRRWWWTALVGLVGCDRLETAGASVSPVVVQGLYLGMELPEGYDFEGTEVLEYTAACTVFLAYVSDPSSVEQAPVEGAEVDFLSDQSGRLALVDRGEGRYEVTAADGLVYEPGVRARVSSAVEGEAATLSVRPPEAPELTLPAAWDAQVPLTVDLAGGDYQNVVAAVYDLDRGRLTFDNLPVAVDEVYAFTHPEAPVESVEIPGEAWLRRGTYVVGVAGMRMADSGDYEGVNTTLSAFMAGMFELHLVVVEE